MIEFKTFWNKDIEADLTKLKAFTNPQMNFIREGKLYAYNYKFGVCIILYKEKYMLQWVNKGKIGQMETLTLS